MQLTTDIHGLFILILAAFTLGSTFLSAYSVLNVVRLRNVRQSWKAGKLFGYPLFATLFLMSVIAVTLFAWQKSLAEYYPIAACYAWIGINWFAASFFASKRYITDHGIVKNINDPSQTVPWFQITDFVEKQQDVESRYIFFYQESHPEHRRSIRSIRLELDIPASQQEEFQKIVSYKLGKTIRTEAESLIDTSTVK